MHSRITRYLILILITLFSYVRVQARNTYIIQYDKLTGAKSYFKKCENPGKSEERPIKRLRLEAGDLVIVRVVNLNEFVFSIKVNDEQKQRISASGDLEPIRDLLADVLPGMDMIQNLPVARMAGSNRGEFLSTESSNLKSLNDSIFGALTLAHDYAEKYKHLVDLVSSTTLPLDSIRPRAVAIIDELTQADVDLSVLRRQFDKGSTLTAVADLNSNVLADFNDLKSRFDKDYGFLAKSDMRVFANAELSALKKALDDADFTFAKQIPINIPEENENDEDDDYGSTEPKVFDGLEITLEFFKKSDVERNPSGKENDSLENMIRYYHPFFVDSDGEKKTTPCSGCRQVVMAEGQFCNDDKGPPIKFEDLFKDNYDYVKGAYGLWRFYDEDGNLTGQLLITPTDAVCDGDVIVDLSDENEADTDPEFTEKLYVEPRKPIEIGYSAGFNFLKPFGQEFTYILNQTSNGDSLRIDAIKNNEFTSCGSASILFRFPSNSAIIPSISLGLGLNLLNDPYSGNTNGNLNIMTGLSLSHKRMKFLALTTGLAMSQRSKLLPQYQEGYTIEADYGASIDTYLTQSFRPTWYFGLLLNF